MTPHLDADLAVTLADDRPGMLAKAISCVSAAGINIAGTQALVVDPGANDRLRRSYEDKVSRGHRIDLR